VLVLNAAATTVIAGPEPRSAPSQADVQEDRFSPGSIVASAASTDGNVIPPGFPSAASTGVPAGLKLTRQVGDVLLKGDGAVLEGVDLEGCVIVRADDVTIRNSRIRCAGRGSTPFPIRIHPGHKGLHVSHTEIDGLGAASVAIVGDNWVAAAVNIHNSVDGPRLSSNTILQDSYVHDLARRPRSHNDTVQTLGGEGAQVLRNTLLAYNQHTNDPMNGVLQTGRLLQPLKNTLVEGNYMDGGSYSVRGGSSGDGSGLITNYTFRNNQFGRNCGFGPVQGVDSPVSWDVSNTWADTGMSISAAPENNHKGCHKRAESAKGD
jgi:hypothetical protein